MGIERPIPMGSQDRREKISPTPLATAADGVMILGTKEKARPSRAHTLYRVIVARSYSLDR